MNSTLSNAALDTSELNFKSMNMSRQNSSLAASRQQTPTAVSKRGTDNYPTKEVSISEEIDPDDPEYLFTGPREEVLRLDGHQVLVKEYPDLGQTHNDNAGSGTTTPSSKATVVGKRATQKLAKGDKQTDPSATGGSPSEGPD